MFTIRAIDSFDAPGLVPYRTLRRSAGHMAQGVFVAEGEKVVRRLLESSLTVVSLLLPEKWLREYEPLLKQRAEHIDVYLVPKPLLEQMAGMTFYQGVLAVAQVPESAPLDALVSAQPCLLAAADALTNSYNLGSLMRNATALGAHGLIVGERACSPYLRGTVRSSMGTVFELPVHSSADLVGTLGELRLRGVRCIAAHPRPDARPVSQVDLRQSCCVVFGSEGEGLPQPVVETCDESAVIPMPGRADSLNVAAAAAVFFYEATRQRSRA